MRGRGHKGKRTRGEWDESEGGGEVGGELDHALSACIKFSKNKLKTEKRTSSVLTVLLRAIFINTYFHISNAWSMSDHENHTLLRNQLEFLLCGRRRTFRGVSTGRWPALLKGRRPLTALSVGTVYSVKSSSTTEQKQCAAPQSFPQPHSRGSSEKGPLWWGLVRLSTLKMHTVSESEEEADKCFPA